MALTAKLVQAASTDKANDKKPRRCCIAVVMSALGHEQTYAVQQAMSALHPIATAKATSLKNPCPLYARKRTCALRKQMSAKCQKRTCIPTQCDATLIFFFFLSGAATFVLFLPFAASCVDFLALLAYST